MDILFAGKPFERFRTTFETVFPGHEMRFVDHNDLMDSMSWPHVIILRPGIFGEEYLSRADNLILAQQWGAGVEGMDVEACTRYGVYACNVPSRGTGNAEGVAEIALMHMMLLGRRYKRSQEKLMEGKFFSPPGSALWKKRACVIGLGDVGHCVVERLNALGMNVIGVNRTLKKEFTQWGLERIYAIEQLDLALAEASYVILCMALNDQTRGFFDESCFRKMKKGSFLINVARGPLVDRQALEKALEEERISGAGLDVLWEEPALPGDPLLDDPRITVTPHIGGVTDASLEGVMDFIAANVRRVSLGLVPLSCLNCRQLSQ
ncbi:MAG TPA: 2-hydroxyacid dehydrogenase [Synergistales bacterium]|nr:2-hydroxyacid dehydrogenase [Synergistales bacterium]